MGTGSAGKWELQSVVESVSYAGEKFGGEGFGGFFGEVAPNLSQVYFCCLGKAEVDRSANSFLPRAMMRLASNLASRPSATSARPRSISGFSSASWAKRNSRFIFQSRNASRITSLEEA